MMAGVFGLLVGGVINLTALAVRPRRRPSPLRSLPPNPSLSIEPPAELEIPDGNMDILRALFGRYQRLVVLQDFPSGYSGAQTYLVQPIDADGRADAYTIVKVGTRPLIRREFDNYVSYVMKRLPPVTGRIQEAPVTLRGSDLAGIQYTFIGEPGHLPRSLQEALLEDPDPAHLYKLFDTFGPNWWMQRRPYNFRLVQEYDRFLPPHYVVEPSAGRGVVLDGRASPGETLLSAGQVVTLRGFTEIETRGDRRSLSLRGVPQPGQPSLRVRWIGRVASEGVTGRIAATRRSYLEGIVAGFDRFGLPDPLEKLPAIGQEALQGTRSTIHGDLNLENILIGPGGLVWLIDFAQTRDGHTLLDFAHLHGELIAHVISPRLAGPEAFLAELESREDRLLAAVRELASRCLFDPRTTLEYDLALYMVCLGGLKYPNLTPQAKHLLYLTAAFLGKGF
jgi:hypothetical protein